MPRQHRNAPLYIGCQFGEYRILEFIDSGGFALIFEAESVVTGERVAIKALDYNAGPEAQAEFYNESDLLVITSRRSHVIERLGSGDGTIQLTSLTGQQVDLDVPYIVLRRADGSLRDLLLDRDQMPIRERLRILRDVAKGVHQLHLSNIVHRDLKSGNILLVIRRRSAAAFVADLGRSALVQASRRYDAATYAAGRGDPSFLPPELLWIQGECDGEAWKKIDIYGIGSIFFELVMGIGITAYVFQNPRDLQKTIARIPVGDRADNFRANRGHLVAKYRPAFEMFESQLPRSIAADSRRLLEQLCNPDPSMRIPRPRYGGRRGNDASLEWLLRRIDTLILRAKVMETTSRRSTAQKGIR